MTEPPRAFPVHPIGVVSSSLKRREDAPRQGDEGAPDAWLLIEPSMRAALDGINVGDDIVVLSWFDRADRSVLRTRPRNDPERAERGVFSTRSPDRPNPIGLHEVTVLEIDEVRLRVNRMEALDGTPIVDIKPVLAPLGEDDR